MSIEAVISRINQLSPPPPPAPVAPKQDFSRYLAQANGTLAMPDEMLTSVDGELSLPAAFSGVAQASYPLGGSSPFALAGALPGVPGTTGSRMVALASQEVGRSEINPGTNTNDSVDIDRYRTATKGAWEGAPWCAYFVSYIAAQAGAPLGESGQGFGSVEEIRAWGSRTGRLIKGSETPQPGDLILFTGRHIGMVESVDADGTIHTIEGNSSDKVSRREYLPGSATDFVRP